MRNTPGHIVCCGAGILLFFVVSRTAAGQPSRVDSLTARASVELTRGNPVEARRLYEAALHIDGHARDALLGHGKTLLALELWGEAEGSFNTILDRDSADIGAHYQAGIAYRENGKTKAWILRNIDWAAAREHFFWVIRHDSAYGDVFSEYARLLEYRREYPQAIATGYTQLLKRPDDAGARLYLYRLYRSYVMNDRSSAIEWLQRQETPIALFFAADAMRREGRIDEAEKSLLNLLSSGVLPLTQSIYLALARIEAKRDNLEGAEKHFWHAVDEVFTQLGADLVFEDLKYIVTDGEHELYRSLDTPQKRVAFVRALWDSRNPAAAGEANVRIGEHYRRLVYSEEHYEYGGFRTGFNNPDRYKELSFPKSYYLNQEFNDMGLIFIRHGEPDSRERSLNAADMSESWLYNGTDESPRRIFHFQEKNAVGNNWRLLPYPEDISLLQALTTWDVRFADMLGGNSSSSERIKDNILDESREAVQHAFASDEYTWKKEITTFHFPYSIDAFRGTGAKSLVDISYAIPLAQLSAGSATPEKPMRAEIGISIHNRMGQVAMTRLDTLVIPPGWDEKDTYASMFRFLIPPASYVFAMHVRPLEGNSFGNWKFEKTIEPPGAELALSDLQYLLPAHVKSTLEIDGVKVTPSPFSAVPNDRPLYTYFRVYNLVKDADGRTSFSVRYLLTPMTDGKPLPDVDPDVPDEKTITLAEKTRDGSDTESSEFGSLDISRVKAGRYLLIVSLKDRKRVQTVSVRRMVEILEP